MNSLFEWISRLFESWKFWIVVPPWDIAVRVRVGKRARALNPGFHWRIPFVDEVTVVNTRQRIASTSPVDNDLGDGRVLAMQAMFGYRIYDPLSCVMTFTMPDVSIASLIQSGLAKGLDESVIERSVNDQLYGTGVELEFVCVVSKARVRAFRILNSNWVRESGNGAPATTGIARA